VAGPYALAVWIGNFEGQGNRSFVGVDAAAPLFFRMMDALNLARPAEGSWPDAPPSGAEKVTVCAASGDLPNAFCPATIDTWYIPGKSPIRVSQLHRAVAVDARTGRPVCPPYPDTTRFDVYEFWPSDMLKLFREAGTPRRIPPELPTCATQDSGEAPRIASPLRNVDYALRRSHPDEVIPLQAHVAADVRYLFWFDGNALIAKTAVGQESFGWRPSRDGSHLIRVIDDHGRSAERDVQAQFTP
jgi:penicillin-binding protein 1C